MTTKNKILVLVTCFLFFAVPSSGQCPDRNDLLKRIALLHASKVSPQKQLPELLSYLDNMNACPYRNDSTHSFLAQTIADLYFDEADYLKSVQYFSQSIYITTSNANKPSVKLKDLIYDYYWLAGSYDSLNNVSEKMKAIDSCITYAMRLRISSNIYCIAAMFREVKYSFDVGDYHRCIDYAIMCEKNAKEYASHETEKWKIEMGRTHAESALLWRVKALLTLKEYESAEKLLVNKLEEYKSTGLRNYLGTLYSQLAGVETQKGNYKKALSFYNNALKYDREAGYNFNCKQTLNDIGYNIYFDHFGDDSKALLYYRNALGLINKDKSRITDDAFESLNIFSNIAEVFVKQRHYDSAYSYFQLALDQIRPGITEADILGSPPKEFIAHKKIYYLIDLLIGKADAYRKEYQDKKQKQAIQKAILIYKITDQVLGRIKAEQTELESKLFWRSDSRRLYEHAVEACHLAGDINNAFYFFEKSRAVLLQDQLNEQEWLGVTDIMKRTQLNKKIAQLERDLKELDKTSKKYSDTENELFSARQERQNVIEVIKTTNPLYYQSFMNSDSIAIRDAQRNILNDHEALLELFAGDSAVYLLAITKQKSYLKKINKTAFDNLSSAYVHYLSDANLLNRDLSSFADISSQLYQLIFHDLALPIGRVIISPDGRYFPFESLVTNKQSVSYFLENYAVSYTYSARYLLNNFFGNSSTNSNMFFGMAPVHCVKDLPALMGSDQSLKRMQTYFRNVSSFVGSKATKKNFLNEYYRYRIVQLYTHATDSSSSGDPEIYFADSTLSLSDLFYENKPASSLIVLSACETADGKLYNGEGVFSFNRQFAALGIPSCVSTLWQADNKSTYAITELFYKYLSKGLPMDVALQKAKKEFIQSSGRESRLPYYWAAPILVGQSGTIRLPQSFPWRWATAFGILALIGIGGWQVRKRIIQKNRKSPSISLQT
jgi:CHAT domain-containing protein/tetratricopeptide (TPR) repeat protein